MTRLMSTGLALLAGAALATPPNAEPSRQRIVVETQALASRTIQVSPVDLASDAGRAALERQIRTAARAVCDREHPRESLYQARRSCTSGAFRDAMEQVAGLAERQRLAGTGSAQQISIAVSAR